MTQGSSHGEADLMATPGRDLSSGQGHQICPALPPLASAGQHFTKWHQLCRRQCWTVPSSLSDPFLEWALNPPGVWQLPAKAPLGRM